MNPENKISAGLCKICDCHIEDKDLDIDDDKLTFTDPVELLQKKRVRIPSWSGLSEKANAIFENWETIFHEESEESEEPEEPKKSEEPKKIEPKKSEEPKKIEPKKSEEPKKIEPKNFNKKYYDLIREVKEIEITEMRMGILNKMSLYRKQIINNKISKYELEQKFNEYYDLQKSIETKREKVREIESEIKDLVGYADADDEEEVKKVENEIEEKIQVQKDILYEIYNLEEKFQKHKKNFEEEVKKLDESTKELETYLKNGTSEMKDLLAYSNEIFKEIKDEEEGKDPREPRFLLNKFRIS